MKISFNPSNSNKNILDLIKNNKDIIFDLKGHSIFARGVEFKGTDTNTWRDIKINNVSIGSHTLDLRNGSNTTLTNTNGIVTINSTWRPVVDNLTSDSTTSSLSAKQGKVLKALIDGKSNSDHNHDGRYLKLTGGTMASNALITFADSGSWDTSKKPQGARGGLYWTGQSDYAKLYAEETVGDNLDLVIQFGDDNSNGLSIRNKANTQTSYISSSGVITTGTFKGNLDWSYITNKPATATRWPSWAEVTGKPSSFTPSTHTHGLSNSVFFLNMPSINGNAKWKEVFGYPVKYNLLLSVRINNPAPEWCVGYFGSGILYGGSDTKGFMSSAYNEPFIMWAGGNGSSDDSVPKWYIGIKGTHKSIYNLATIASEANAAYNLRHSHANKSVLDGITSALVNSWNTAYNFVSNSYPILTTQNTYVNNNKGYINGTEITQVNNADTLDGAHLSDIKNWSDRTASAYWKAGWYKVASAQTATNTEAFLTLDVNAVQSKGHATLFIRKRADSKPYFICTHNNNLNLADFRLYYNGMSMVLYARVPNDWHGRVFRIISEGREGTYEHIWTLYSNASSTDPNAISAEGGNPYINPTYSGRVDWSNSSDKANYANSAGSVAWNNVTGKPSEFNPAAHTHTVFKNNLMIKGTNGISDSASIHLGIGDSDTGFKWISDGVCQIYANNAVVGQWTSGGMNWFKNPTVNGNKVWNAGNDGSGSGLDADTLDGYHAASFVKMKQFRFNQYKEGFWTKILTITINSTSDLQPVIAFNWIPSECAREVWAEFTINWRSNSPIFYAIWKGTAVRTLTCVNSSGNIWNVWVQGDKNNYDPFGEVQVTYAHNISSYNGGSLGYSDSDPGGTRCTLGGYVNYARSTGNADTVDGQHASAFSYKSWWHWYGKDGQPNWLWGGNNENDYYVYNPSNFRVAYASSAGNADTLDGEHASSFVRAGHYESNDLNKLDTYSFIRSVNSNVSSTSPKGNTGWYNVIQLVHRNGASDGPSYIGQIALGMTTNTNDMFFRGKRTDPWKTVIHSGNYTEFINNYYWANVKISTSSSTTTSPTVSNLTATNSIRLGDIHLEYINEINSYGGLFINYRSSADVYLCQGGGNVCIGATRPTQKLDVRGNIITKGLGIQPYYLSKSVLPTIRLDDGYTYKCLEISATTEISCIIADRAGLMSERGILIKFNKGYDGQIILLKDLQSYGSGNGYFWVMPSGCNIINADHSSILVGQNQISNTYDDGRSRFLVYSSVYSVWIEFLCSNTF